MTTVVCSQCRANVGELEAVGGQLGGGVGECDFAREQRFVPGTLQTERDVELSPGVFDRGDEQRQYAQILDVRCETAVQYACVACVACVAAADGRGQAAA